MSAHRPVSPTDVRRFFRSLGRKVILFAGFGELGYQEEGVVERIAQEVLGSWPPDKAVVACGTLLRRGGHDGIARVYAVAKTLGFETSGIHPSIALEFSATHQVSPHEDHVFFVEDATWGGFLDGGRRLSPTLHTILEVSDELVVIGGGKHAADELAAFLAQDKKVRFFAAEMNHQMAREWCVRAGVEISDFRGAAHEVWQARSPFGRQR